MSYGRDLVNLASQLKFPVTEHDTANDATDDSANDGKMMRMVMIVLMMR